MKNTHTNFEVYDEFDDRNEYFDIDDSIQLLNPQNLQKTYLSTVQPRINKYILSKNLDVDEILNKELVIEDILNFCNKIKPTSNILINQEIDNIYFQTLDAWELKQINL